MEDGEACDDADTLGGDGCSAQCAIETGFDCAEGASCTAICGDSRVVSGEVCDYTAAPGFTQYCDSSCSEVIGRCGDGILQDTPEECDDGDADSSDGCNGLCRASFGFECTDNSCDASPLLGTKTLGSLTTQERTELCTWFIGTLGGPGVWSYCGTYNYQSATVSSCASNIAAVGPSCTVAQLETWVADRGSACQVYESSVAICP